jgi:mycofactocin precursor
MTDSTIDAPAAVSPVPGEDARGEEERLLEEDLLVEDVSIDGMCGVY